MAYFIMSSPKIFLSLWPIYLVNYDFMLFLKGHKLQEWTKRGVIHQKNAARDGIYQNFQFKFQRALH